MRDELGLQGWRAAAPGFGLTPATVASGSTRHREARGARPFTGAVAADVSAPWTGYVAVSAFAATGVLVGAGALIDARGRRPGHAGSGMPQPVSRAQPA